MPGAAPVFLDQAGGLQDLQVLRHSRTADRQTAGEFTDRRRLAAEQVEHGLARRIGERPHHLPSVSHTLR